MELKKEHLAAIIKVIKKIKAIPGNEAFISDLQKVVADVDASSAADGEHNPKIEEIYEYCIEKIVRHQAEFFYANFPIPELIPKLIADFIEMERSRRRDDFTGFCHKAYKQIERISNKMYQSLKSYTFFDTIADEMAYAQAINNKENIIYKKYDISRRNNTQGQKKVDDFIAKPNKDNVIKAMDQIQMVLYFIAGCACAMDWELKGRIYDIYVCRNAYAHGGPILSDWQQQKFEDILADKGAYYLIYQGALVKFVLDIKNGILNNHLGIIETWSRSIKEQQYIEATVTITKILPSIFFATDDLGQHYESVVKCSDVKQEGDKIKVLIGPHKNKTMITRVLNE